MRDDCLISGYRVVIVTLDAHAAGPAARVETRLAKDFPGISVSVHAAAEWAESPSSLDAAKDAVRNADIIIANLLFIDEHIQAILPELTEARDRVDAFVGMVADGQVVRLTKMGDLDMTQPASAAVRLLKKLRGSAKPSGASGEKQMKLLRRLPRILRFIPGKAQDVRAWFLTMQYWLAGSEDNVEAMIRYLLSRYASRDDWRDGTVEAPIDYPLVGLYHPDLKGRTTTDPDDLPKLAKPKATIGLLMMRSYVLASDTAHYDAVIRAFEAKGIRCIPAFAGGLDGRPAIDRYFQGKIDAFVSLTGFSLVGGPAYNDSDAAVETLKRLDVPYIAAHPLEFQTLGQWAASSGGLGPIETTMLIALPEIDGATNPTVFAGRHGEGGCAGCAHKCMATSTVRQMAPCFERIDALVDKTSRLAALRRKKRAEAKVGVVLFGFPPNAGAVGTAAYLSVFESLFNTLKRMDDEGYSVDVPNSVDDLRDTLLKGNSEAYGQDANVIDIA